MKKIILAVCILVIGAGCSSSQSGDKSSEKYYLASNIVFGQGSGQAGLNVDTTTQIPAANVILDNAALSLSADNVQSAFDEAFIDLNQAIIGSWTINTILSQNTMTTDPGVDIDIKTLSLSTSIPMTVDFADDLSLTIAVNGNLPTVESAEENGLLVTLMEWSASNDEFAYEITDNSYLTIKRKREVSMSCGGNNCPPAEISYAIDMKSFPISAIGGTLKIGRDTLSQ